MSLRVRVVGGVLWLAWAVSASVSSVAGGVVQIRRERALIRELLRVRACGAFQGLLLCTDGLSSYRKQALKAFGEALRTGKRGAPDSFCRRASWSPKRSSDTLGDE